MGQSLSAAGRPRTFGQVELSFATKLAAVLLGTALLAAASWITVPMYPVPITMQNFTVLLVGALGGRKLGTMTVLAWLGEAAMGMPVLAHGAGGILPFVGPTAGYLLAYPIMAFLAGLAAERGLFDRGLILPFLAVLGLQGLCLAMGTTWLGYLVGSASHAVALGAMPFFLGDALKAGLLVAGLTAAGRIAQRRA